ncbi:hypothetical protein Lepto7376_4601 [[Leptolyngbya] sp. PCC 7376]|nr:hypothetical protein Lepto7376_4601 [[Leptolyngbya] sp. PCC 7376]
MDITPTIRVNVINQFNQNDFAVISKANQDDMPKNWQCNWTELFAGLEEEYYEGMLKIEHRSSLLGLVKFALYPDPPEQVEFVEILNLEAVSRSYRSANPIGQWLVWYVCHLAIQYCPHGSATQILFLTSVHDAFEYYRDIIKMEYISESSLGPGEDGYVFRFKRQDAIQFCNILEELYGSPTLL